MRAPASPLLLLALVAALPGCASRAVVDPAPLARVTAPPADRTYRLQPGDVVEVKYLYSPEFDETVTIRPDGVLTLPLAQEVQAAGLTPAELTRRITEASSRELREPHVTLMVRSFAARQVFVAGHVEHPQLLELTGGLTALQAIAMAGGFLPTGRYRDVILIRRMPDGSPVATTLNVNSILDGTDLSQDVELRPRDIVYVTETRIARVNRWVQQYLRDTLPTRVGFSFSYRLNDENDDRDDDVVVPASQ